MLLTSLSKNYPPGKRKHTRTIAPGLREN